MRLSDPVRLEKLSHNTVFIMKPVTGANTRRVCSGRAFNYCAHIHLRGSS